MASGTHEANIEVATPVWSTDRCLVCDFGGEVLCCDICPASVHLSCVGLSSVPSGHWKCPICTGEKTHEHFRGLRMKSARRRRLIRRIFKLGGQELLDQTLLHAQSREDLAIFSYPFHPQLDVKPKQCAFCKETENLEAIISGLEPGKAERFVPQPFWDQDRQQFLYCHFLCALWSPLVYYSQERGTFLNVEREIKRSRQLACSECFKHGAGIGCVVPDCRRTYHYPCAKRAHCQFINQGFHIKCPVHATQQILDELYDIDADSDSLSKVIGKGRQRLQIAPLLKFGTSRNLSADFSAVAVPSTPPTQIASSSPLLLPSSSSLPLPSALATVSKSCSLSQEPNTSRPLIEEDSIRTDQSPSIVEETYVSALKKWANFIKKKETAFDSSSRKKTKPTMSQDLKSCRRFRRRLAKFRKRIQPRMSPTEKYPTENLKEYVMKRKSHGRSESHLSVDGYDDTDTKRKPHKKRRTSTSSLQSDRSERFQRRQARLDPTYQLLKNQQIAQKANEPWKNVGGLKQHITSLKECFLLPLIYPEIFRKFGIEAPKGLLLHGPPGTGKTLLARTVAACCGSVVADTPASSIQSGQRMSFKESRPCSSFHSLDIEDNGALNLDNKDLDLDEDIEYFPSPSLRSSPGCDDSDEYFPTSAEAPTNTSAGAFGQKITFYERRGPDLLSKFYGDTEKNLQILFEKARATAPSIIYFDEIDGLIPTRNSRHNQVHSSVVATLLSLMDGLDDRGQVFVIGSTNRIDSVDPALRRPGRFDRELFVGLPDCASRKEIFDIHTEGWFLSSEKKEADRISDYIAARTRGFSGADIGGLCREAALFAYRRHTVSLQTIQSNFAPSGFTSKSRSHALPPSSHLSSSQKPNNEMNNISITMILENIHVQQEDFNQALESFKPNFKRSNHSFDHLNLIENDSKVGQTEHLSALLFEAPLAHANEILGTGILPELSFGRLLLVDSSPSGSGLELEAGIGKQFVSRLLQNSLYDSCQIHTLHLGSLSTSQNNDRPAECEIVRALSPATNGKLKIVCIPQINNWWANANARIRACLLASLRRLATKAPVSASHSFTSSSPSHQRRKVELSSQSVGQILLIATSTTPLTRRMMQQGKLAIDNELFTFFSAFQVDLVPSTPSRLRFFDSLFSSFPAYSQTPKFNNATLAMVRNTRGWAIAQLLSLSRALQTFTQVSCRNLDEDWLDKSQAKIIQLIEGAQ